MIGVIISGHGGFASGLGKAVTQIIGEQPQFKCIDFPEDKTTEQLDHEMQSALQEIDTDEGIVFLTDLLGGTPFRTASTLSQSRKDIEVVTGSNLQMAAEMLLERDELTLVEFREQALKCGHRGMTSLYDELNKKNESQEEVEDDGI